MKVATWAALVVALVAMVFGYIPQDISPQAISIARNVFGIAGTIAVFLFLLDLGFHGKVYEFVSFLAVALIMIACWLFKGTPGDLVPTVLANGWVEGIIEVICVVVILLLLYIGDFDD